MPRSSPHHFEINELEFLMDSLFSQLGMFLLGFFVVIFLLSPFIQLVPRHERRVFLNRWTGRLVIKDSYWNFIPPYLVSVPNRLFPSYSNFPTSDARPFTLDPPRVDLRSEDGVAGTADIQVELSVLPYTSTDLERLGDENLERRAKQAINAWLTDKLSRMSSANLRDYAGVQRELNLPSNLESLDAELKPFLFKVKRIFLDYGGIQLSQDYLNTVAAKIKLEGQSALLQVEAANKVNAAKTEAEVMRIKSEADIASRDSRIKAAGDNFALLLGRGMSSSEAVRVLTIDRLAEALERTGKESTLMLPASLFDPKATSTPWENVSMPEHQST